MVGLFLIGLTMVLGRVAAESVQTALSLDERLAGVMAPALNRGLLDKALKQIGPGVATSSAAVQSSSSEVEPTVTPSVSPQASGPQKIEIINTTTIAGAAKQVGALFPGATVESKNGQTQLDETVLLYKSEYKESVSKWQDDLKILGWEVKKTQILPESDPFGVRISLGGK